MERYQRLPYFGTLRETGREEDREITGVRIWWPNIISNKDLFKVTGQEDINVEIRKKNLDESVTH